MRYDNIRTATFVRRINRFVADIEIDGEIVKCHVKNTGRCRELLLPGTPVYVQHSLAEGRKTAYDLISVYKGDTLVNIDSQAPNEVFGEWIENSGYFPNIRYIKRECTYGNSRFDFYIETDTDKIFVEVKGVTLENEGVLRFPDAPTTRGAKHMTELAQAVGEGYKGYVFFVAQMKGCHIFTPNSDTDPNFALSLKRASDRGVKVCCVDCVVGEDTLCIDSFVEVSL